MATDWLMNIPTVTIAICTYGRPNQIAFTLKKLSELKKESKINIPVFIVDNNPGGETYDTIRNLLDQNNGFTYLKEAIVGLSHARNRAVFECQTEYIAFIDDDAYPDDNYFNELLDMCKQGFDVAGGGQIPFSDSEIPEWYILTDQHEERELASGFNMVFRKSMIQKVGLFDIKLGMRGKKTAYGEDVLPQLKIKQLGGKFLYNRNLRVYHYIQPYKLTKKWQFESSYAHGRDSWRLFDREKLTISDSLYLLKELLVKHLSFSKDFTKQKSMAFELGRIAGSFIHMK